jgi:hypothetical protein
VGCCVALAYLIAWARRGWLALVPAAATPAPFAPAARRPAPGGAVAVRPLPATPTARRRPAARALVAAGLAWCALGVVGMHVLGWFAWAESSLLADTAFHSSGLWVAAAGLTIQVVRS